MSIRKEGCIRPALFLVLDVCAESRERTLRSGGAGAELRAGAQGLDVCPFLFQRRRASAQQRSRFFARLE